MGQPADQVVINDPEPAGIQVQPEASSVRRSSRATKGITSRYKDFVLGEEAQNWLRLGLGGGGDSWVAYLLCFR